MIPGRQWIPLEEEFCLSHPLLPWEVRPLTATTEAPTRSTVSAKLLDRASKVLDISDEDSDEDKDIPFLQCDRFYGIAATPVR